MVGQRGRRMETQNNLEGIGRGGGHMGKPEC